MNELDFGLEMKSPNLTLIDRVHVRSGPALEVPSKVGRVGERPYHAKPPWRMGPCLDPFLEGLGSIL